MSAGVYKAFLSYSHAADGRLAPVLQSALHRFAKPFYRLRTMHVFRDKTGLQLTPELWPEIRKKLHASESFVLLASPQAAASPWVNMEIEEWLHTHDNWLEKFYLVLTHGQIIWNRQLQDFDWNATDALPSLLAGQFEHEPFYLDLRWTQGKSKFVGQDAEQWLDDVGTLAATLLDRPKDELIGEDRRQFRLVRRLIFSGTALVVTLAIALTAQFFIAQRRARAVLANQLSAQATNNVDDPQLNALLAIESMRLEPSVVAERQLHRSAELLALRISSFVHEDEVIGVRFLPGDEKLLTASHDGSARVWKIEDGMEVQRKTFSNSLIDIAASPDGQLLAASSYEDAVAVWRADNGETLLTYPEQYAGVDFAPSGRRLAVVGRETVIWDVSKDGRIEEVARKKLGVGSTGIIAFSDDARRLAIGGTQFQMLVVNVPTLEEVMRCEVDWVMDVALNKNGTLLAAALDDNTVRLWQVPNCKEILRVRHESGAIAVAISADGQFIATGSHDGNAKVFRISNSEQIQVVEHDAGIWDVTLSPDARLLATSGRDGTARIWDVETGRELQRIPHAGDVYEVHFSSDGTTLATASEDGTAAVWDITATTPILAKQIQIDDAQMVGFIDEGKGLLTASSENHARVFDVGTGKQYPSKEPLTGSESAAWDRRLIAAEGVVCPVTVWRDGAVNGPNRLVAYPLKMRIAMSRDCRYLATGEELSKETEDNAQSKEPGVVTIDAGPLRLTGVRIWDCQSGQEVAWIRHAKDPTIFSSVVDMQFSPDARFLATAGMDKTARLWSVTNGTEVRRFEHQDTVIKVLFSPDGKQLATGSEDRSARVWSVSTGELLADMPHEAFVSALAFSRNGQLLATAKGPFSRTGAFSVSLDDENIRVWEIASKRQIGLFRHRSTGRPWERYKNRVNDIAFSPDGHYLASASEDKSARIWALSDGEMLARLDHPDAVDRLAFSPDGRLLATEAGSIMRVFHWRGEDLVTAVCSRLTRNLSKSEWHLYMSTLPYRKTCPNLSLPGNKGSGSIKASIE